MAGRPAKFDTVEQLQATIDGYFIFIQGEYEIIKNLETGLNEKNWLRWPEMATITGLALWLGFESRQSFHDYKGKKQFSYTIKRARLKIENEYEKKLGGQFTNGVQFALKNLGWQDKTQTELTGKDGGPVETKIQQITGIKVQ